MRTTFLALSFCFVAFLGCEGKTIEAFPEKYVGIGVELKSVTAGVRVVRVLDGGAAALSGIAADDVILAVSGIPLRGKRLAEVVDKLRGAPGTEVALRVRGKGGEREVQVKRSAIKLR